MNWLTDSLIHKLRVVALILAFLNTVSAVSAWLLGNPGQWVYVTAAALALVGWATGTLILTAARRPFPPDGVCDECQSTRLVIVELASHVWEIERIDEGVAIANGSFEWGDDSHDPHVECLDCATEYTKPEHVEYE